MDNLDNGNSYTGKNDIFVETKWSRVDSHIYNFTCQRASVGQVKHLRNIWISDQWQIFEVCLIFVEYYTEKNVSNMMGTYWTNKKK